MWKARADALLKDILRLQPSLEVAVVLGPKGEVLAQESRGELAFDAPSLLGGLTTVCHRSSEELGRGQLGSVWLEGSMGQLVLVNAGEGRSLGFVAARDASPGLLVDDAHALVERLRSET